MFNILGTIGDIIKKGVDVYKSSTTPTPQQTVQNIVKDVKPQVTQTPKQIVQSATRGITPQVTKAPVVQSYGLNDILKGQTPQATPIQEESRWRSNEVVQPVQQKTVSLNEILSSRVGFNEQISQGGTGEVSTWDKIKEIFSFGQPEQGTVARTIMESGQAGEEIRKEKEKIRRETIDKDLKSGGIVEDVQSGLLGTASMIQSTASVVARKLGAEKIADSLDISASRNDKAKQAFDEAYRKGFINPDYSTMEKIKSAPVRYIAGLVAEGVPTILATTGTGFVAAAAGAPTAVATTGAVGMSFLIGYGSSWQDAKKFGASDKVSEKVATWSAVSSAVLEFLPQLRLLSKLKGSTATKNIQQSFLKNMTDAGLEYIKSFGKQGILESGTEVPQTIIENAWKKTYDQNQSIFEGVTESALAAFFSGGITDTLVSSSVGLNNRVKEVLQNTTPQQRQGGYIKFGKTIEKNIDKLPEDLRNRIEVNSYLEDEFKNNPLNKLTKYESKSYPGELPEFTGERQGKFTYKGKYQKVAEDISKEISYDESLDIKDVEKMYSSFIKRKREFEQEQIDLKKEALNYLKAIKNTETFSINDAVKNPNKIKIIEPAYVEPKVNLKKTREFVEGKPKEKIVAKEETLLKDRIKAEADTAKKVVKNMKEEYKPKLEAEYGKGEVTGYFQGEKEGRAFGKKIGEFKTKVEYKAKIADIKKQFTDKANTKDMIKKSISQFVTDNLPVSERGRFVNAVATAETMGKLNETFQRATKTIDKLNQLKEQSSKLGSLRSKQAFLTKIGEFANVTIRDMKKKLGLEGIPIRKMTEAQLNAMIEESKVRLGFKRKGDMLEGESKPKTETPESEYKAIADKYDKMTFAQRVAKNIRDKKELAKKSISSSAIRTFQPIADTLENISGAVAYKFQQSKRQTLEKVASRQENVSGFAQSFQKSKMSQGDKRVYKKAWVDNDIKKLDELNKKYSIKDFDKLRETYDEIIEDRNSISDEKSKVNRRDDYFNRVVTNSDGLGKWLVENADVDFTKIGYLGQKYREKSTKLGRELTKQEKSKLLSNLFMTNQLDIISMAKNGNFKKRMLDKIPDELLDFYADPVDSLRVYIQKATEEIEMRKMFLGEKMESASDFDIPVSDLILGNGLADVADGKLSLDKLKRLQEVVKAHYGQHGSTNWFNQKASDSTTIAVMSSPTSAIKNLADIYLQMVEEGIPSVLQAATRKFRGQTELDLVKMGIDDKPVMEIDSKSFGGKMVKNVYKYIGFTMTEGFNKSISLEAAVIKARKQSNKVKDVNSFVDSYGDLSKYEPMIGNNFMNKMVNVFGDNPKLIKDAINELQSGKVGELTKDIAFKRAGNRTVLTDLDKPINYLENPNARILYKLKTYQIKITNNHIKNGWKLLGSKNPKTRTLGAAYIFRTAVVGTLFNTSINTIIDILMGKEIDLEDAFYTGAIQTLLPINRYGLGTIATKGLWEFIEDTIAPPLSWTNNVGKDIGSIYKTLVEDKEWKGFSKLKSIQNVPFVGKFYYNWYGAGVETKEYQEKQKVAADKKKNLTPTQKRREEVEKRAEKRRREIEKRADDRRAEVEKRAEERRKKRDSRN